MSPDNHLQVCNEQQGGQIQAQKQVDEAFEGTPCTSWAITLSTFDKTRIRTVSLQEFLHRVRTKLGDSATPRLACA